ncbi:MAG: phosphatase PAP2 family protein [Acidobacteria bacterium]|nr:phosphatase PAP2 family protein [Acidobacteriota bacterium]
MAVDEQAVYKRPYFFELFTLVNLAIIVALTLPRGLQVLPTLKDSMRTSWLPFGGEVLLGIGIRLAVAARRGEMSSYLRRIRSAGWIVDTLRLLFFTIVMIHTYGWIKLTVPILHPRLFDPELWNIDQRMLGGYSPTVFLLTVFRPILSLFDWSYANIFFASIVIAFSYFLSAPERKLRVGFADGNTLMWILGAWLYLALPSVGPAYRFPEVWFEYTRFLPITQHFQLMLMRNYQAVIRIAQGGNEPISIIYGVAAFPSLHVAFQTYTFLWMRKQWRYGQIVFGIFLFFILLGSMVTGWHYLIDGIAGLALAVLCYWASHRWAFRSTADR